ncbi:hypothetical protein C2G38_2102714 [Gigaspora rosea]|uniref:Uncharacterized protein n=1 Tax=Gigaspora rosea TaxID=44941 RepID=A0A397UNH9_9GLOM|nr:hypothetical protein C2G38_2102714 [Gigaspora rosea]
MPYIAELGLFTRNKEAGLKEFINPFRRSTISDLQDKLNISHITILSNYTKIGKNELIIKKHSNLRPNDSNIANNNAK